MLWIGVLPALSVFYVRKFVKEPPIWLENRRRQRVEQREVHAPLISIFKPRVLGNTLTACLWLTGLAEPMIIGTWIGCVAWAAAAFYGPETKDKVLVPDLVVA
jgi:hypothetical protein